MPCSSAPLSSGTISHSRLLVFIQLEDLKSQQVQNAQQAEKQKRKQGKGHQDEELRDLHSTLQGAAEEEEVAEVDEETAQYIGQLQRLKSVLELFRQQQVRHRKYGVRFCSIKF